MCDQENSVSSPGFCQNGFVKILALGGHIIVDMNLLEKLYIIDLIVRHAPRCMSCDKSIAW